MLARLTPLLLLGTVLVSACGDDDDGAVAVEKYAQGICDALTKLQTDLGASEADLTSGLDPNTSPTEGKGALQRFFDRAVSAADDFVDGIEAAGTPDTENGEEAAKKVREAAAALRDQLKEAGADVADLPTDDPAAFAEAATALGEGVQGAFEDDPLESLDAPELKEALDATTCGDE